MGGGGFSMEPDNPLLDLYLLKLAAKKKPKVCFVPTAKGVVLGGISAGSLCWFEHGTTDSLFGELSAIKTLSARSSTGS